jgi:hypothetical protein
MLNHHSRGIPLIRRGLPLLAGLIVACNGSAGAAPSVPPSAGPTATPTSPPSSASPSGAPSIGPTIRPSATPAAQPSTQPSAEPSSAPSSSPVPIGKVDHPTDPNAVVLRIDSAGGFINPVVNLLRAPAFTLYGDNTALFRSSIDRTGTGMPPFLRAHLSADQVDTLLTHALIRDRLKDAETLYPGNPDAGSTIFSIDAGGVKKQVSVSGLIADTVGPSADILKGLADLSSTLTNFETQVKAGKVESVDPYQPPLYRAILRQGGAEKTTPWPWTDVTVADFSANPDGQLLLGELTADQVAKVTAVPSGGASDIGLIGPAGKAYLLSLRPVLPGEIFQPAGRTQVSPAGASVVAAQAYSSA